MAKLSAHGRELARRETPNSRIAVMSDGQIMRNWGYGWKLWKRLKPAVNPEEYARKFNERTRALPSFVLEYIGELQHAVSLEHRAELHTTISLMPNDPDGVWAHFDDYRHHLDFEDIDRCCRAYQLAERQINVHRASTVVLGLRLLFGEELT